jgi:hypothetical protein
MIGEVCNIENKRQSCHHGNMISDNIELVFSNFVVVCLFFLAKLRRSKLIIGLNFVNFISIISRNFCLVSLLD